MGVEPVPPVISGGGLTIGQAYWPPVQALDAG